jgi:sugar-specific transcriptional regulator TrmB
MMFMARNLESIGFTSGEEKVYIALLRLGSSTTGAIAKEAGVSRSKLYEILEKLSRKGIVSHYKKNNVSYFTAAPPSRIVDYLKEKEALIEKEREEFEKSLPMFENFLDKNLLSQDAQVFEGMDGIKSVRETALNNMHPGDVMYYFGNSASGHANVLGYWDDWNNRRVKKKIWAYIIYNQDSKDFGERRKRLKYTKVKYLVQKGVSHAWIEIYGDTVAIVMKYQMPMSIVINNKFVAESFKTYFNILWSTGLDKVK